MAGISPLTLKQFFANPLLAETNMVLVIDAVYDEMDDAIIACKFNEVEEFIKEMIAISPHTQLAIYISARVISRPFKNKYNESYRLLCKKIYEVCLEVGGMDKVYRIAGNDKSWSEEILEHHIP